MTLPLLAKSLAAGAAKYPFSRMEPNRHFPQTKGVTGVIYIACIFAILSFVFLYNLLAALRECIRQAISGTPYKTDNLLDNLLWASLALAALLTLFVYASRF